MITIRSWRGRIIHESAEETVAKALMEAHAKGAVLTGADLTGADLTGAVLTGADLTGADLRGADLRETREDVRAILDAAPHEVSGLRLALVEGRVDGTVYEGECACLIGTIANIRGCAYTALASPALAPDSNRPAERFFLAIYKGLTPDVWEPSRLVVQWIDEWMAERAT